MNEIGEVKCIGYDFCPYITDSCRVIGNFHGKKNIKKKNDAQLLWSKCRYLGKAKVAMRSDWVRNKEESASRWVNVVSQDSKPMEQKKIKNIPCRYCDKKVSNLKALDQHVSAVHNELWSEYTKDQTVQARLSASNLTRCDKCGFFVKNMDEHVLTCSETLKTNEVAIEDKKHCDKWDFLIQDLDEHTLASKSVFETNEVLIADEYHSDDLIDNVKSLGNKELEVEKSKDEVKEIMNFDELYTKRKNYVDVARENNFEEGLLNLLTELYPDNAHFIYELLQNAEDAGATKVLFELEQDKLLFYHDGTRLFDYDYNAPHKPDHLI